MRILIDINHPAHVHFFKNPAAILRARGHEVIFTSRDKECAVDLLKELGFEHTILSTMGKGSVVGFAKELLLRNFRLFKLVTQCKPDVMCAIGGTFIAHVGFVSRVPSLAFYDTEMASLQNSITYPLLSKLCVPNCYQGDTPSSTERYQGYHELSYLGKAYFTADKSLAVKNGLDADRRNFILRVVSWQANHDINEAGWSQTLLEQVFLKLSALGNVIISSERELPPQLEPHRYQGNISDIHHVMAFCDLFVGESATMASECAVLGVPSVYAATISRGYLEEQEEKYQLVKVIKDLTYSEIDAGIELMLNRGEGFYRDAGEKLQSEAADLSQYIVENIEKFSE